MPQNVRMTPILTIRDLLRLAPPSAPLRLSFDTAIVAELDKPSIAVRGISAEMRNGKIALLILTGVEHPTPEETASTIDAELGVPE